MERELSAALLHCIDAIVEEKAQAKRLELILQPPCDFSVNKGKKPVAHVYQRYSHTQRREDSGVLAPDHAAADDGHALGDAVHMQYRIGIVNHPVIERDVCGMMRRGARRD